MKEVGKMGEEDVGLEGGVGEEGDGVGGGRGEDGEMGVEGGEEWEDFVNFFGVVCGDGGRVHNQIFFRDYKHNIVPSLEKFKNHLHFFQKMSMYDMSFIYFQGNRRYQSWHSNPGWR